MNLLFVANIGFSLLTLLFSYLLVAELRKGIRKTAWPDVRKRRFSAGIVIALLLWLLFVGLWSGNGMMGRFDIFPMNFLPILVIPLVTVIGLVTASKPLAEILFHIPQERLLGLQVFRVFVELLLWALFIEGLLPKQMTFEGWNFDILAGLTGPLAMLLIRRGKLGRTGLIIWNLVCLALLINIVTIAILSTPSPIRMFMNEPANTIVAQFPISWLPGFLVPLAYTLHLFSLKKLLFRQPEHAREKEGTPV